MLKDLLQQKIYCTERFGYKFSNALYNYRKSNKLSQNAIAEKVGVCYTTIASWERGLRLPNSKFTPVLSELLSIHSIIVADMIAREFNAHAADNALTYFFTLMSHSLGRNIHIDQERNVYFCYNVNRQAMVKRCKLQFSLHEDEIATLLNQRYCEFNMSLVRILDCYNFATMKGKYTLKKKYNKLFEENNSPTEIDLILDQLEVVSNTYDFSLKNVLEAYLNKNNLKLSDVSDICDADESCIYAWLHNSYFPRHCKAEAVCIMLGMHPLVLAILRKDTVKTKSTMVLNVIVLTVLYSLFINLHVIVDIYNGYPAETRQQTYIPTNLLRDVFGLSEEEITQWRITKAKDVMISVRRLYEIRNNVIRFLDKPVR